MKIFNDYSQLAATQRGPSDTTDHHSQNAEIEAIRRHILSDAATKAQLRQRQPELIEAAETDPIRFALLMQRLRSALFPTHQSMAMDPMSQEAQERIEEAIKEQNIAENLATAMEFHPESFGSVTMLYIDAKVNHHPIKAFVDCGAQTTIS